MRSVKLGGWIDKGFEMSLAAAWGMLGKLVENGQANVSHFTIMIPRSPGTEARTIGLSHPCLCRLGKSKPLSTEHCASMGVFAKSLRSSQYSVFCPDPMISFRQLRTSMMRRFVAIFDISSNIFMAFALLLQGTFQKRALPWMF